MKIAVQGCCHGALDDIYSTLQRAAETDGEVVDLLLCCGDFQAVRNCQDLNCMAVPNKYKKMGSFYKYYSGEKKAPMLTVFIGGNHEASNHLRELGHGGWVAPNIYFLGHSGVVRYGGLRIAGISGIYKSYDYNKGHFEAPPYNSTSLRTAYHVRSCDVYRLGLLTGDVDIMMSHDWPLGIHRHGNYQQLFRFKPYFRMEAEKNELGSPPAMELLKKLCPSYWFSGHLHCKFAAAYRHANCITKFLALDKCLPRGGFLQILDIPSTVPPYTLEYDSEWLSIMRVTDSLMSYSSKAWFPPTNDREIPVSIEEDIEKLTKDLNNDFTIPNNFEATSPPYKEGERIDFNAVAQDQENSQTRHLCEKLGIQNPWSPKFEVITKNPAEILLESEDEKEQCKETVEGFEIIYSDQEVKSVGELSDKEIKQVPSELLQDENPDEIHIPDD